MKEGMTPMFCIGYDEKVFIPEGMLPAECITDVGAIDVNKAFKFFIERVRELERQNAFFLKALNENFMCPYSICKYDVGSDLDEWECTDENNGECWIQAAKEAGE